MAIVRMSVFIDIDNQIVSLPVMRHDNESHSVSVWLGVSEITLFGGFGQLIEFGRAIVRECETFAVSALKETDQSAVTHDFRPGAYASNDAVQHDAAMASVEHRREDDKACD